MRRILLSTLLLLTCGLTAFVPQHGLISPTAVISVTAYLGSTGVGTSGNGNAGYAIFVPFITPPPSYGNITVSSLGQWVGSAATANWGLALYANSPTKGVLSVSNGTLSWVSGSKFSTLWCLSSGCAQININGQTCTLSSVTDTTTAAFNTSACTIPSETNVSYEVDLPGSLICEVDSSTAPSNGFSETSVSGCGNLSAKTMYWVSGLTMSNTQDAGIENQGSTCVGGLTDYWLNTAVGSFTSFASSVGNNPAVYAGIDGCSTYYAVISYKSANPYNIIQNPHTPETSTTTNLTITFPNFGSGHRMRGVVFVNASPLPTINSVYDCTGGNQCSSSTDTISLVGSCSSITYDAMCFFGADSVTSGINTLTVNLSGGAHVFVYLQEITGPCSSSCLDQSSYTSTQQGTPFTWPPSALTLAQSTEFALGAAWYTATGDEYDGRTFLGSGNWSTYSGFNNEGAGIVSPIGIFYQTTTSNSLQLMGTFQPSGGSNIFPGGVATWK